MRRMPEVLDPGEGKHRIKKYEKSEEQAEKDAKAAANDIGRQGGLNAATRWAYWRYLRDWNRCGKKGRRWTPRDIAQAHKSLAVAIEEGNEERIAGFRRFLLMDDDCGERKADTAEDNGAGDSENGGRDPQGRTGDVPDQPDVRPSEDGRPEA